MARAADGDPPPINLSIDNDRDGVPDELSLAVQTVLSAEGSEAQTTALADLYKRLRTPRRHVPCKTKLASFSGSLKRPRIRSRRSS